MISSDSSNELLLTLGLQVVKNPLSSKNLPANAGEEGLIPGSGRYPGEGNGNLL